MGGTLPLLVAARGGDRGKETSLLYGTNTLGAVGGTLAAGFVLLEAIGTRGTLRLAGAANLLLAGCAFLLARGKGGGTAPAHSPEAPARAPRIEVAAALAGFAALSAQGTWMRALAQFFENSVYSFAAVLAVFLAGVALGSLAVGPLLRRIREPLAAFGGLQGLEALLVLATIPILAARDDPATHARLAEAGARGLADRVLAETLFAATVVLLPTFLSGACLPLAVAAHPAGPAAAAGRVYAANALGSVGGALLAGFLLLPSLGIGGSLQVAAGAGLAASLLAAPRSRAAVLAAGLAVAAAIPLAFFGAPIRFWRALDPHARPIEFRDDAVASACVVEDRQGRRRLKVNNTYSLGGADGVFQERRQGILPLLLQPGARSLLWIGLGTGNSLGAASRFPLERIACVEIVPSVAFLARHFAATNLRVLEDPRVRLEIGDGRAYLRRTSERFDVLVVDLLLPWEAGAGLLMTREFHEEARRALAPGGLFVQWLPLHQMRPSEWGAVVATALEVFPNASLWIAYPQGNPPIVAFAGRAEPGPPIGKGLGPGVPDLRAIGEAARLDPADARAHRVAGTPALRAGLSGLAAIRDDDCRIEFEAPRSGPERAGLPLVNLEFLRGLRAGEPPPAGAEASWHAVGRILEGHAVFLRAFAGGGAPRGEEALVELRAYAAALREAPTSPYANAVCVGRLEDAIAAEAAPADRLASVASEMLAANPRQAPLLFALGRLRERAGAARGAEEAFEEALAVEPSSPIARLHLGYLRFDRGAREEARAYLEEALRDPAVPTFHRAKASGVLRALEPDPARARAEFERALRIAPGDAQLRRWIERTR
jgi:spermidine synthase